MAMLRIDALGTVFSIDTPVDEAYMQFLLDNYKKMTDLVAHTSGEARLEPLQLAIMSGIMLCDELYKEKKKHELAALPETAATELAEAEKLTASMIARLEQALAKT